jgi:hypothetical protein
MIMTHLNAVSSYIKTVYIHFEKPTYRNFLSFITYDVLIAQALPGACTFDVPD